MDIAKVEGGEQYKAYMMGELSAFAEPQEPDKPYVCAFPKQICAYWPWGKKPVPHPMTPMLTALLAAAESTLETKLDSVLVSFTDMSIRGPDALRKIVHSMLRSVKVDSWGRVVYAARQLVPATGRLSKVTRPYFLPGDPSYSSEQKLILTVDYTRHSMAAALWLDDNGNLEMRSRLHRKRLGHDGLEACRRRSRENDPSVCDESWQLDLRNILTRRARHKIDTTGPIFVTGELGSDETMLALLREVVSEIFSNGNETDFSLAGNFSHDLTYAGSRATAWAEFGAKERQLERADKAEL